MRIERLITMANEIAAFFAGAETESEAPKAAAYHLERFWTPAMRRELIAYLRRDGSQLSPVAAQAATRLAEEATGH